MKKIFNRFKYNFLFSVLFTVLLLLPDYIFEIFFPYIEISFDPFFVLGLLLFGFFLSLSGKIVFSAVCILFFVFQYIQLNHVAFFGRPLNPVDIRKIGGEFSDVILSGLAAWRDIWFVTPLLIATFAGLFYFFFKFRRQLGFSFFAVLVVLVALGVKPERAARKSLKAFLPAETRYSFHNSLNTFSFFLVNGSALPDRPVLPSGMYRPVSVEKIKEPQSDLIVLIMGESMGFEHMGLFGYQRPTTPRLNELKKDPQFFYKKALSGAVSTHSALPIFFNLMNEPGNLDVLYKGEANLFGLAKKAGYKTHWVSVQDAKNTHYIGVPYIDDIRTYESEIYDFSTRREDHLVELFQNLDVSEGRHFVVLHFRTLHSPYEGNYKHRKKEFSVYPVDLPKRTQRLVNEYDNAMMYTDDIIARILEVFRKKDKKNSILMMTADHGQLLGMNGVYGHNILNKETAYVPFLAYGLVPEDQAYQELDRFPLLTHYQIGKTVAGILGFAVHNPNEKTGESFIHGNNIFTDYQLLRLVQKKDGLDILPIMTLTEYASFKKYISPEKE